MRSIAIIAHAIALLAPRFPHRAGAASELAMLGDRYAVDPLLYVSIVHHESRWDTHARNPRTGALGLGQVMPAFGGTTEWRQGLRVMAAHLASWRDFCLREVGTGQARYFLQGYGGFDAVRGTTCGHEKRGKRWLARPVPSGVRDVLMMRDRIARNGTEAGRHGKN